MTPRRSHTPLVRRRPATAALAAAFWACTVGVSVVAVGQSKLFVDDDPRPGVPVTPPDPAAPPAGPTTAPTRLPAAPQPPRPDPPAVVPPVVPPDPVPPPPAIPRVEPLPPPPAGGAVAAIEALVRDLYRAEYARRGPAAQRALARLLAAEAYRARPDPASFYVLMREVRDLSAAAGDADAAVAAARAIRNAFAAAPGFDGERAAVLAAGRALAAAPVVAPNTAPAAALRDDARRAVELLAHQSERDWAAADPAAAAAAAQLAEAVARRTGDDGLVDRLRARRTSMESRAADRAKAAAAAAQAANDPAQALAAGRLMLGLGDDPAAAVRLLAAGADPAIRLAATRDADVRSGRAAPRGPADLLAVADAWADLARVQPPGPARDAMYVRAADWYDVVAADPGVPGLAARKRLADARQARLVRGGLRGEYFAGTTLTARAFTRVDPTLAFGWLGGRPAIDLQAADFSARWTGHLKAAPGAYRLVVLHDDACRVWIDGALVIDQWHVGDERHEADVRLTGAFQAVRVEFAQYEGGSKLGLGWVPPGGGRPREIPADVLYHDPADPDPAFPPPVRPDPAAREIVLAPAAARLLPGPGGIRFADHYGPRPTPALGFWTSAAAWPAWEFDLPADGEYAVAVRYSCGGPAEAASRYALLVGAAAIPVAVDPTGDWDGYRTAALGTVRLSAGPQTLAIKPTLKPAFSLMNVAGVTLTRVR